MFELTNLPQGCSLYKQYFPAETTSKLFQELILALNWQQPLISTPKGKIPIPRKQVLVADELLHKHYNYSGIRMTAENWPESLNVIRHSLLTDLKISLNTALVNLYENGQHSVGWHADNESLLGPNPIIVSLSLGASRSFHMRNIANPKLRCKILLEDGDLFLMGSNVQKLWQHAILKEKKCRHSRINITFRNIIL